MTYDPKLHDTGAQLPSILMRAGGEPRCLEVLLPPEFIGALGLPDARECALLSRSSLVFDYLGERDGRLAVLVYVSTEVGLPGSISFPLWTDNPRKVGALRRMARGKLRDYRPKQAVEDWLEVPVTFGCWDDARKAIKLTLYPPSSLQSLRNVDQIIRLTRQLIEKGEVTDPILLNLMGS